MTRAFSSSTTPQRILPHFLPRTCSRGESRAGVEQLRFVAESRKAKLTLTLIPAQSFTHPLSTGRRGLDTPPHLNPFRWHRRCPTNSLIAGKRAALISARKFRRGGMNEDRNRSPGSSSSSPYSSPSQSPDLPPMSTSIGSAFQCSLANRRQ